MAQDNYRLQMEQAQARFLTYDQNRLIEKFSLQADGNYLYLSFLGTPHRLSRKTGSLEYKKDVCWQDGNTFSRVLTLLDILCDSKDTRCPSGVWQSMESFGRHVHQTLLAERDPMAEAFDKDPQALAQAARQLGAKPIAWGDVGFSLEIMDGLAIGVQFWRSDEDFPAQIRWFWDKNALDYLRYETMYYAVSLVRQELWEAFNAQIAEHFGDELR